MPLILGPIVLCVLVVAGGGATAFFISKKNAGGAQVTPKPMKTPNPDIRLKEQLTVKKPLKESISSSEYKINDI